MEIVMTIILLKKFYLNEKLRRWKDIDKYGKRYDVGRKETEDRNTKRPSERF